MRYKTKRTPSGWWVVDTSKQVHGVPSMHPRVEKHKTEEDAQRGADRLNGICAHCGRPLAECKRDTPRDENFGGEYDDSEPDE